MGRMNREIKKAETKNRSPSKEIELPEDKLEILNELKAIFPDARGNLIKRVIKNNLDKDMDFLCTRINGIKQRFKENVPKMNREMKKSQGKHRSPSMFPL